MKFFKEKLVVVKFVNVLFFSGSDNFIFSGLIFYEGFENIKYVV